MTRTRAIAAALSSIVALSLDTSPVRAQSVPAGAEFQANTYTTQTQELPRLATDGGGNFVTVWTDDAVDAPGKDGSHRGVFGRRFDSLGNALGGEFQVNTYTTGQQLRPAVGVDASGDFVVVWADGLAGYAGQDGDSGGIVGQRYDSDGNSLGGEFQINTYTTGEQTFPEITRTASGGFVVVWFDNGRLGGYGRRYDSTGAAQGGEFQLSFGASAIAADPAGGFVISGETPDGDYLGIAAQRFDSSGNSIGTAFAVNTYTTGRQLNGVLATDSAGNFLVVWRSVDQDGDQAGVFGRRFDSAGTAQGSEFQVNTYTSGNQTGPAVAADAGGDFTVTWASYGQDGQPVAVYRQRYDGTGAVLGAERLTRALAGNASVAAQAEPGRFVVVYEAGDGSGGGVFGQRFFTCRPVCGACQRCEVGVGCTDGPKVLCRKPGALGRRKAILVIKDKSDDAGDRLIWRWRGGETTAPGSYGDPVNADDYTVCIFEDGAGAAAVRATAPAGGLCAGGQPCWKALGNPPASKGFRYKDRDRTPDGIDRISLRPGVNGKAKIPLTGRGPNLDFAGLPPLSTLQLPLRVQVQLVEPNNVECWGATYPASSVVKQQADLFKARAAE